MTEPGDHDEDNKMSFVKKSTHSQVGGFDILLEHRLILLWLIQHMHVVALCSFDQQMPKTDKEI